MQAGAEAMGCPRSSIQLRRERKRKIIMVLWISSCSCGRFQRICGHPVACVNKIIPECYFKLHITDTIHNGQGVYRCTHNKTVALAV